MFVSWLALCSKLTSLQTCPQAKCWNVTFPQTSHGCWSSPWPTHWREDSGCSQRWSGRQTTLKGVISRNGQSIGPRRPSQPANKPTRHVLYITENPNFSKIYCENASIERWDEPRSNPVHLKQKLGFVGRLYKKVKLSPYLKTYSYFHCFWEKKYHNMYEPQKYYVR